MQAQKSSQKLNSKNENYLLPALWLKGQNIPFNAATRLFIWQMLWLLLYKVAVKVSHFRSVGGKKLRTALKD